MTKEVWLPVLGYEGTYEASNLGAIRRVGKKALVQVPASEDGYLIVSLSRLGFVRTHRVHVLVLSAFSGRPPFADAEAAHNDGDKRNCRLTNLRWSTSLENAADVARHGRRVRGSDVFGAKLTEAEVRGIRLSLDRSNPSLAADYGVSVSTIHLIRHNRIWRHV
jgi:hypothetical protein